MITDKKTKIVATIGPASEDRETLKELADAGVNVIRCNFSHGDFPEHQKKVDHWRDIADTFDTSLGVLQDLSGPKIRTGSFANGPVTLSEGDTFTLTTEEVTGDSEQVHVTYDKLPDDVAVGDQILLDDGKRRLEVTGISDTAVTTEIKVGGEITGHRGVNLPDTTLSVDALTEKDRKDLQFGVKNDVDFVALSFVQEADDVQELRTLMKDEGLDAQIIAKIETQQAVDNIDEILAATDGIMVARGDLAVEIGPENVPEVQKELIDRCKDLGMPVITATQMLESMTENPVPTRAEVSDVANAILDGTDAVMLSGETTIGENPVESVAVMVRVAHEVESRLTERFMKKSVISGDTGVVDSVTASAVQTAHETNAQAIVALTSSGFTARMISRLKPQAPIITLSPYQKTCNQVALSFGCYPLKTADFESFDNAMEMVRSACFDAGVAEEGDLLVVVAGLPFYGSRLHNVETNMMFVEEL
jgi:pyruvate kinase